MTAAAPSGEASSAGSEGRFGGGSLGGSRLGGGGLRSRRAGCCRPHRRTGRPAGRTPGQWKQVFFIVNSPLILGGRVGPAAGRAWAAQVACPAPGVRPAGATFIIAGTGQKSTVRRPKPAIRYRFGRFLRPAGPAPAPPPQPRMPAQAAPSAASSATAVAGSGPRSALVLPSAEDRIQVVEGGGVGVKLVDEGVVHRLVPAHPPWSHPRSAGPPRPAARWSR